MAKKYDGGKKATKICRYTGPKGKPTTKKKSGSSQKTKSKMW